MDSGGRILPSVFIEIFDFYPLTPAVNKIFIYKRPGFVIFFGIVEAFDRQNFSFTAAAGV